VRRRGVLHIGVTGLALGLVQGCSGGSKTTAPPAGGKVTGSPSPSPAAPSFDPSSYTPPKLAFDQLKKLYSYDATSFLDAVLTNQKVADGLVIEDVTFSDTKGGTIPAYVATPDTPKGRQPGVVFAHGAGEDRDAWLPEISDLAKRGVTAMAAQVPFKVTGDPTADSAMVTAAVLAQRRALDLLARRDDTDPTRLAFVGHGWGGALAQVLMGLEKRLNGVVLVGTGARLSQTMVVSTPKIPADPAARKPYLDALTRFDGARYVSVTGMKRSVLLQFGGQDTSVPPSQVDELVAATVGAKDRKDYAAADAAGLVKIPDTAADRWTFLAKVLKVK
jgi:dienelactone hydrolase